MSTPPFPQSRASFEDASELLKIRPYGSQNIQDVMACADHFMFSFHTHMPQDSSVYGVICCVARPLSKHWAWPLSNHCSLHSGLFCAEYGPEEPGMRGIGGPPLLAPHPTQTRLYRYF